MAYWLCAFNFDDIHNLRNIMPCCKGIKELFDAGKACILMDSTTYEPSFRLKILCQDVMCNPVFESCSETNAANVPTVGQYDGISFLFRKNVPFTRILSLHARRAYMHAKKQGWLEQSEAIPDFFGSPLKNDVLKCIITSSSAIGLSFSDEEAALAPPPP